jgi:hypothetical protein
MGSESLTPIYANDVDPEQKLDLKQATAKTTAGPSTALLTKYCEQLRSE